MPKYKTAKRISVYLSMPNGEISTKGIVLDALSQGKQVFVPYLYENSLNRVDGKSRKIMEMVSIHSREDYDSIENHRDNWGIPTVQSESVAERSFVLGDEDLSVREVENKDTIPKPSVEKNGLSRSNLEMIVMPGVAFDVKCGRLGHGKGFYDMFLQRYHDDRATSGRYLQDSPKEMPFLGTFLPIHTDKTI